MRWKASRNDFFRGMIILLFTDVKGSTKLIEKSAVTLSVSTDLEYEQLNMRSRLDEF